ncbi:PREDICTED: apolipoprotein F [Hipposideros armiger]|uniref:Apolipoprotein F n=1 Tax=Hipposideros armiger TaxID=186990 RepID=A0A8B7TI98_HIPAR|nr:PREDICTED: apolipoprotein F [Hipposideros armiger]XP_019524535.1 PREDICTED: apolipoprotein F [Hipposideros armiger]
MGGLRYLMIPIELLLYYLLLYPMDAISYGNQTNILMHLPSSLESWPPSSNPLTCQTLLPKSLPGYTHMAPLPKFLIGLPLMIALKEAGCHADVQALQRQLFRLGGVKATQVLFRHLQGLEQGRSTGRGVSVDALASALQLLAREQQDPERARRSLPNKDCEYEQEQYVHNIVQWLPGVGTFYDLGTALYYAAQNCLDKAKQRGQQGAIDLGYDLLMTMTGMSGGPLGVVVSTALKPAVKAGVQRLIQYYHEKEANIPPPETSEESLGSTPNISDIAETTTIAPLVSEIANSTSYWEALLQEL